MKFDTSNILIALNVGNIPWVPSELDLNLARARKELAEAKWSETCEKSLRRISRKSRDEIRTERLTATGKYRGSHVPRARRIGKRFPGMAPAPALAASVEERSTGN